MSDNREGKSVLTLKNVTKRFSGLVAVNDLSLDMMERTIHALIGPNGAGKSTAINIITGLLPLTEGEIYHEGTKISGMSAHQIAQTRCSRTFQNLKLYRSMTVKENLMMGIDKPKKGTIEYNGQVISGLPSHKVVGHKIVYVPEGREIFPNMTMQENLEMGAYSVKMSKADMDRHLEEQYEIFPRLKERAKQKAGSMSGGEQQMLAIARGLMSDPELLMLDEPSLGLAPVIVDDMFDVIVRVNKVRNIPIAIVERNAFMAMSISNRTYVLEVGNLVAIGDSKVLMDSDDIKKAYLGG